MNIKIISPRLNESSGNSSMNERSYICDQVLARREQKHIYKAANKALKAQNLEINTKTKSFFRIPFFALKTIMI